MKKLLFIISILFSLSSFGQSPMFKLIAKKASSCSYLLDTYTGAAAAYSLRKLNSSYSGSAIRVRRSSDNTEQDIGFTGTCGDLDTSSLKTFVGSNNGFIVTWYDQSGNGRNMTQSTNSKQPQIISSGDVLYASGKPSVLFASSNQTCLNYSSYSGTVTANSTFGVFMRTTSGTWGRVFSFAPSGSQDHTGTYIPIIKFSTTSTFGSFNGASVVATYTPSNSILNIVSSVHTGSEIRNTLNNNSTQTNSTSFSRTINVLTIGTNPGDNSDAPFDGYISEIIWYQSDKDSDASNIRGSQNNYYSIY